MKIEELNASSGIAPESRDIVPSSAALPPVRLNPLLLTGFLGTGWGISFTTPSVLDFHVGELKQDINILPIAKKPPFHIYFSYKHKSEMLWYLSADSLEQANLIVAAIKEKAPVEIFFGEKKPIHRLSELADAYREDEDLSKFEHLLKELEKDSPVKSRYTKDELQQLQPLLEELKTLEKTQGQQQLQLPQQEQQPQQPTVFETYLEKYQVPMADQIQTQSTPRQQSLVERHPRKFFTSFAVMMAMLPTGAWALFNTGAFTVSAMTALALSAAAAPAIGAGFISYSFVELSKYAYLLKHGGADNLALMAENRDSIPYTAIDKISLRGRYMGAQFFVGSLVSQLMTYAVLDELSKTLNGGAIIGGAPLEAQMLMMALSGIAFGISMLAIKVLESYNTGKKLSTTEMVSSFVTGLIAGMGFHVASMIPGMNNAYDLGMPGWSSALVSGLGYMTVLASTFGPHMFVSIDEYGKLDPLDKSTLQMVRLSIPMKEVENSRNTVTSSLTSTPTL